ncbi:MAG: complex I NDUFA9 subunit family protein [Rickettsiales bacterium]|nr:complex I NDUFA9 subunit family protein [Rickettsiales bacterium]
MKIAVIFGGSGFVGKSVIRKLLKQGFRIKVITRDKEKSAFLKTFAAPDFLTLINWNYQNFDQLDSIISGADFVVNLVGILAEENKNDFDRFHTELSKKIAQKCQEFQVKNLVYVSALGVDKTSKSKYAASKIAAEKAILENFSQAIILRPSIIFGEDDNFFNKFAAMSKTLPILPLINHGQTKFQPIYVEDLAEIISKIPDHKKLHDKNQNKIYEIGSDKIYSFKELLQLIGNYCDRRIIFINLPFFAAKILAFFLEIFTKKILTQDQVEMLKIDNVISENNFKQDFSINPKSIAEIVPNYIK